MILKIYFWIVYGLTLIISMLENISYVINKTFGFIEEKFINHLLRVEMKVDKKNEKIK